MRARALRVCGFAVVRGKVDSRCDGGGDRERRELGDVFRWRGRG